MPADCPSCRRREASRDQRATPAAADSPHDSGRSARPVSLRMRGGRPPCTWLLVLVLLVLLGEREVEGECVDVLPNCHEMADACFDGKHVPKLSEVDCCKTCSLEKHKRESSKKEAPVCVERCTEHGRGCRGCVTKLLDLGAHDHTYCVDACVEGAQNCALCVEELLASWTDGEDGDDHEDENGYAGEEKPSDDVQKHHELADAPPACAEKCIDQGRGCRGCVTKLVDAGAADDGSCVSACVKEKRGCADCVAYLKDTAWPEQPDKADEHHGSSEKASAASTTAAAAAAAATHLAPAPPGLLSGIAYDPLYK